MVTGVSLRWIATAAAAGPSSIVIWIGAWLCFYTPLALSVLELSSRYPSEGGLYVWSKRAFGDFSGFMSAWTYWTSNLPYFPAVLYFAASNILFMRQSAWEHLSNNATFYIVFSLLTLGAATLMNIVGLDVGKWLHNVGALAMWIPVGIVIVLGADRLASLRLGHIVHGALDDAQHASQRHNFLVGADLCLRRMRNRILHGRRDQESPPLDSVRFALRRRDSGVLLHRGDRLPYCWHCPQAKSTACRDWCRPSRKPLARVGFPGVLPVAAFLIALSNIGAAGAYLAAVARLPFVAGIDRFLPPAFGALHPRWKTPWVALLTQFVLGALFIFLGQAGTSVKGAYDVLVSMGVITYFIPYLYLFAAMIKLQRDPAGPDVIRVPGGSTVAKLVAMLGFVTTGADNCFLCDSPTRRAQQTAGAAKNCGRNRCADTAWRLDLRGRKAQSRPRKRWPDESSARLSVFRMFVQVLFGQHRRSRSASFQHAKLRRTSGHARASQVRNS